MKLTIETTPDETGRWHNAETMIPSDQPSAALWFVEGRAHGVARAYSPAGLVLDEWVLCHGAVQLHQAWNENGRPVEPVGDRLSHFSRQGVLSPR